MTKLRRCKTCRSKAQKQSCPGYPWYSAVDISFCRWQMLWLIENLEGLRLGVYPPKIETSGYIDNPEGRSGGIVNSHARFETPVQLAAEVDTRLDRTGKDGQLLIAQVMAELPLHRDADQALRYITGWWRKQENYSDWSRRGRYLKQTAQNPHENVPKNADA